MNEAVPSNIITMLNDVREVLSEKKKWGKYRDLLHKNQPPRVPYFGVYLADLTYKFFLNSSLFQQRFIDDGKPDRLENALVNFDKNYMLYKVIKEITLYQSTSYKLRVVEEIRNYLLSLPGMNEQV